jgi:hypothetical protein
MARFRHVQYPAIGYAVGGRLFRFAQGELDVPDTDHEALQFFRTHPDTQHGLIIERVPKAAPQHTCPECRATFTSDQDLQAHLQRDHGTAHRNRRAELASLTHAALPPTKAAGGAPEPWSTCDVCGRAYQPRQINQSCCSTRCRVRRYRARQKTAQDTVRNGHASITQSSDDRQTVTLPEDMLITGNGKPAGPKRWQLTAAIDPALGLAVRRIARMRRETVSVTVDRLLRVGVRRYKRTHGTAEFADLPELRSGAGRLGRKRRKTGLVRLVPAASKEAEAIMAAAELVCTVATAVDSYGRGEGEEP